MNWFRRDADGRFLWPGYGDNVRVLTWMVERIRGSAAAEETPIGFVPTPEALDRTGLDITEASLREALRVDAAEWTESLTDLEQFNAQFGRRLPEAITRSFADTRRRLAG